MTETSPPPDRAEAAVSLPYGTTNEFFTRGGNLDAYSPPTTPEEWRRLASTSMKVLATIGRIARAERDGPLDPSQSLRLRTLGTARVDFHEGSTTVGGDKYGGTFEAAPQQTIIKVEPIPRMPEPPATASFAVMQEAAARYQHEVAEKAEITWNSLEPDTIIVARQTAESIARGDKREQEVFAPYAVLAREAAEAGVSAEEIMPLMSAEDVAAREQFRLDELSYDEQIRYAQMLQGAATMAALAAERPDLVAQVQVVLGTDKLL